MITFNDILGKLDGVRKSSGQWIAKCPSHDDRKASLSIGNASDKILLHCQAGCDVESVVVALGLTMSDLFSTNGNGKSHTKAKPIRDDTLLHVPYRNVIAVYDYFETEGKPGLCRYRTGDKSFPWGRVDADGTFTRGKGGHAHALYHSEKLAVLEPGATVIYCEGEKDVLTAEANGMIATTAGGVSDWRKDHAQALAKHDLIIIPDNDPMGLALAQQVAHDCFGIAASVRVLAPLVDKPGGDLTDFIEQGGTPEQLFDTALRMPVWEPGTTAEADDEPRFKIVHADDLAGFPPAEMIPDTILVRGGTNLLWGQPEAGKSLFAQLTSAVLSMWMTVLYVAAEGVGGIHRRLRALELQSGQTYGALYVLPSEVNLMDSLDSRLLLATIQSKGIKPELIVFDTLARCMLGGAENDNSDMGVAVANAEMVARALGATPWLLHHPTKDGRWERGGGALRAALDSSVEITNTDGLVKVELSKLKDGERWEPKYFRILSVAIGQGRSAPCLVPADSTSTAGAQLTEQQLKALEFLALPVFEDCGAHAKDIETRGKIPHASLFRVLSALKEMGLITQGKRGDPYTITQAGRDKLAEIRADTTRTQYQASTTGFSQPSITKSHSAAHDSKATNLWEDREFVS